MADEWYAKFNDTVSGPFDRSAIIQMMDRGVIADDDLISADQAAWMRAADLRDSPQTRSFPGGVAVPTGGGAEVPAAEPAVGPEAGDEVSEGAVGARDRIVVLGRRQAGKTVYLSVVYGHLWRSLDGLTMSAVSGVTHRRMMRAVAELEKGQWPPGTLENARLAFEIKYHRRKRLLISMDYSGEVFTRAFIEDGDDSREVKELLEHLDNAAAVLLLVDPSMVYEHSGDIDAAIDDDFGMVQAAKRVRDWPRGEDIPIVLVLTKMDKNLPLIRREGGAAEFVKKHWPALARTLLRIPIYGVTAVQAETDQNRQSVPSPQSTPKGVLEPLKYCLEEIEKRDQELEYQERREAKVREVRLEVERLARADRRHRLFWAAVVVAMLLIGAFVIGLIAVFR